MNNKILIIIIVLVLIISSVIYYKKNSFDKKDKTSTIQSLEHSGAGDIE